MNFSEALRAIADDDSNDLTGRQREKLKKVARNKRRCRRCEERCELEAHRQGKDKKLKASDGGYGDGDGYGFDWNNLLEFIKGLLPIILSFIDALK